MFKMYPNILEIFKVKILKAKKRNLPTSYSPVNETPTFEFLSGGWMPHPNSALSSELLPNIFLRFRWLLDWLVENYFRRFISILVLLLRLVLVLFIRRVSFSYLTWIYITKSSKVMSWKGKWFQLIFDSESF